MVDLHIRNRRTASPVYTRPGTGSLWKMPLGRGEESKIVGGLFRRHVSHCTYLTRSVRRTSGFVLADITDNPGVERLVRPVGRALAIWLDCFNLDQKAIRYVR